MLPSNYAILFHSGANIGKYPLVAISAGLSADGI